MNWEEEYRKLHKQYVTACVTIRKLRKKNGRLSADLQQARAGNFKKPKYNNGRRNR